VALTVGPPWPRVMFSCSRDWLTRAAAWATSRFWAKARAIKSFRTGSP
jgi:hypothetical protein